MLHEEFTKSADYEGEIGVIVGKTGFRIREEDAMDYVWGYTIVSNTAWIFKQKLMIQMLGK